MYVDHPRDRSKLTCLIYFNLPSSEYGKFLNEFGTWYAIISNFKEHR